MDENRNEYSMQNDYGFDFAPLLDKPTPRPGKETVQERRERMAHARQGRILASAPDAVIGSGEVLDLPAIQEFNLDSPEVAYLYFLLSDGEIVYVGQTVAMPSRIHAHRADPEKAFAAVRYLTCDPEEATELESAFIRACISISDGDLSFELAGDPEIWAEALKEILSIEHGIVREMFTAMLDAETENGTHGRVVWESIAEMLRSGKN